MKKILIATKNKGKIAEFNSLFSQYDVQVVSLYDLPEEIEDIEETGSTFQENAALKAETIARTFGLSTLADDSGLIVDGLGGAPGIYSARYAGEPTDDLKNNQLLLEN
ncbi:MAG TPA: non-canonical purine NTP pyrophosphatase, partial [Bacillota bacterium]|nr:non-canonical purine NTP pyrophosphatase [Bacillota bacterium]